MSLILSGFKLNPPEEKNDCLNLRPVAVEESGEGLSNAPKNWPKLGGVWGWRTFTFFIRFPVAKVMHLPVGYQLISSVNVLY